MAKSRIAARRSNIHGRGVFATAAIPAGEELIEYEGRKITHAQANRIYAGGADSGHTFLFTLDERYLIDANIGGNIARWINHSCDPNCRAVIEVNSRGTPNRVLIESIKPIKRGDELTYDYGIVLDEPHSARMKKVWACHCGSPKCIGTMLKPKKRKKAA